MKKLAVLGAIGISSVDALGATLTDTEKCNVAIESACADKPAATFPPCSLACLCLSGSEAGLELAVPKPLDLANALNQSTVRSSARHTCPAVALTVRARLKLPTVFAHGMGGSCSTPA